MSDIHGRPSLTVVPGETTLDQLKTFTDSVDKDSRIRGKVDKETGNTILYVGKKSSSLFSILTGQSARRRDLAKRTFETLIDRSFNTINKEHKLNGKEQAAINSLSNDIRNQRTATGNHSLRAGMISIIAQAMKGAESYGKVKGTGGGPQLSILGDFSRQTAQLSRELAPAINANQDMEVLGNTFGDLIAARLKDASYEDRLAFVTSTGGDFKQAMRTALKESIGGPGGDLIFESEKTKEFLDIAYDRAAWQLMGNSEVSGTGKVITWQEEGKARSATVPNITIDGVTYEPVRHLGTGGFAMVYEYKATDGTENRIAYKIANDDTPEAINDVGAEIRAHHALMGDNKSSIIGMEGVIRTPDGRLGIALEYAPGGNAYNFATQLLPGVIGEGPGKVPPELADILRLTLFKGMVEGMDHVQNTQGGLHGDLKSPNVLISDKGFAKISDFGTSTQQTSIKLDESNTPDNPIWLAPEVIHTKAKGGTLNELKTPGMKFVVPGVKEDLKNVLPNKGSIDGLTSSIMQPHVREQRAVLGFDNKADTWAVGVMGLDLWTGHSLLDQESFMSKVSTLIVDFAKNPGANAIGELGENGKPKDGALSGTTGNPEVDTLINGIMRPRPEDRPNLKTVLDDPLFKKPGVGSEEAGELILAIKSGDVDRINFCVGALQLKML